MFEQLKTAGPVLALGALAAFFAKLADLKVGVAVGICDVYKFLEIEKANSPAMCAKSPLTGAELTWLVPGFAFVIVCAVAYVIFNKGTEHNGATDSLSVQEIQAQIEVLRARRDAGQSSDANAERLERLEDAFEARTFEALERAVGIDAPINDQTADTSDARREAVKDAIEDGDTNEREAMARIADGDVQGGLNLLESEAEKATTEALEMWRRVGRLADGIDTARALNAFARAVALGSDDVWDFIYLGRLQTRAGDLKAAKVTFEKAFKVLPEGELRDQSVLYNELGNILRAEGDLAGGRRSYEASLEIRETLTARDLTNAAWQRDVSVSHSKIGDLLTAEGDLAGARRSYEVGFEIAEALAARDPANAEWQRDVVVSLWRLADMAGSDVSWLQVVEAFSKMENAGTLLPTDRQRLELARRRAAEEE